MGKYTKKSKSLGEVGAMDASRCAFGPRTRAETLASRHLRSASADAPPKSDLGYLELRSRRLVKRPPLLRKNMQSSRLVSFARSNEFTSGEIGGFGSGKGGSGSVGPGKGEHACLLRRGRGLKSGDSEIQVSFGGNNSGSEEDRGRSNGESTQCSLIKVVDSSTIPGSSMKQMLIAPAVNQRAQNSRFVDMPTTDEIEEFFTREEQLWQRLFIEKYNFDVVNDLPLPGRHEWVKQSP